MLSWRNRMLDYSLKRNKTLSLGMLHNISEKSTKDVFILSFPYKIEVGSKLDKKSWFI